MKKILATLIGAALLSVPSQAQKLKPANVKKVIKAMTLDEKVKLMFGTGMNMGFLPAEQTKILGLPEIVKGQSSASRPVSRFNIPGIVFCDGPAGLHIQTEDPEVLSKFICTGFPVGTTLASSWDTELIQEVGSAMGNEVLEYNVDVLLAPAMNIQRNPLCGRNFEYYSEDPLLSGKMAAAIVRGIQSNGVGTSIKHFLAGGKETNSNQNDARMSQRALREIYLKGFEIAVKESNPWTVMTSYNLVNGVYTSENKDLLEGILRNEWGYTGTVITDWWAGRHPGAQVHAGNDMIMPGRDDQYQAVMEALEKGEISVSDIDRNVERILNLVMKSAKYRGYVPSYNPDLKSHALIVRKAAADGMVLLKNESKTLPLAAGKKVALFGNKSYEFIAGGTGSGDVNKAYVISLQEGLENAGFSIEKNLSSQYASYMKEAYEKAPKPEHWFFGTPKIDEMMVEPTLAEEMARQADAAILTIGRVSGEGGDRVVTADFDLKPEEKALILTISRAFHAQGKPVIVVLNIGGVIETASWKNRADAILVAWQPGQEAGNSVADILCGKVNPSGRLTVTFPNDYFDEPAALDFPYIQMNNKMFLPGEIQKKEGEGPRRNFDYVNYPEDIYVGYRYFNTFHQNVSYPFGFGLSYTQFKYSDLSIGEPHDGKVEINVKVENAGSAPGKTVVQFYVEAPGGGLQKPQKELRAFSKTKLLGPGESQTVHLTVKTEELASFDEAQSAWVTAAGTYKGLICEDADHSILSSTFNIQSEEKRPCGNYLKPQISFFKIH